MANGRDFPRRGEQGLSLIEALVIVTVTALLALLLLPMVSRAAGRNFTLAEHALDSADAATAEREFRGIMRAALPGQISGLQDSVTLAPSSPGPLACAREGAPGLVRLRIAEGTRLVCESEGRNRELLRWSSGDARFAYSAEGRVWSSRWNDAEGAPLVRFAVSFADGRSLSWVERLGAPEADPP